MIPRTINFVWFGPPKPEWVDYILSEWRRLNPDYEVKIHDESVLVPEYAEAYGALTDLCSKSDLLALSAIKRWGGWYFDTDCLPFRPLRDVVSAFDLDGSKFFVTEQHGQHSKALRIANGVLGCTRDHPAWEQIDRYVAVGHPPFSRCFFGPELFTALSDSHPSQFLIGGWPFFYPAAIGAAMRAFKIIRKGNRQMARYLAPTAGQYPFVLHLWAGGRTKLTEPATPGMIARIEPQSPNGKTACYALHKIQWDDAAQPFQALATGLARIGYAVEVREVIGEPDSLLDLADLLVTWNGRKWWYQKPADAARKKGLPALFAEHGFFDRRNYWQVDHLGILHWASWMVDLRGAAPADGSMRLAKVWPAPLRKFLKRDGYILVIGQVKGDSQLDDSEINESTTLDKAIMRTAGTLKLPVFFRAHPSQRVVRTQYCPPRPDGESLRDAVEGARFAVTINSNAGNECLALGCPVLCLGPAIYERAGVAMRTTMAALTNDVAAMVDGYRPDEGQVRNYLEWLACRQWNAEELAQGDVLERLIARAMG